MVLLMPQVGAADDEGKLLAFLGPWCHGTHIFGAKNQLFWCERKTLARRPLGFSDFFDGLKLRAHEGCAFTFCPWDLSMKTRRERQD